MTKRKSYTMSGDNSIAKAFNEGSDANIQGKPITDNPYKKSDPHCHRAWRAGWYDVEHNWASHG